MSRLAGALGLALWNPIVAKEYRSRMRTWRSPLALMVYIVMLAGLGFAIFASMAGSSGNQFGAPSANYGQQLFLWLVVFQMALVAFITPALTAGAISGERERQTIDLLFVTLIPPFSIIWGKLLASISFILLLLALSIPIFSLVFLFGGIEPDQVADAMVVTASAALMLGTIGIACSTWIRRTLPATVAAYGAAFIVVVGSLAFGLLFPADVAPNATRLPPPAAVTYLGPFVPLVTIATGAPVPGYGIRYGGAFLGGGSVSCYSYGSGPPICSSGGPVTRLPAPVGAGAARGSQTVLREGPFSGWQYWQASVAMQLAVAAAALVVAAIRLPPVGRLGWLRRLRDRRRGGSAVVAGGA